MQIVVHLDDDKVRDAQEREQEADVDLEVGREEHGAGDENSSKHQSMHALIVLNVQPSLVRQHLIKLQEAPDSPCDAYCD